MADGHAGPAEPLAGQLSVDVQAARAFRLWHRETHLTLVQHQTGASLEELERGIANAQKRLQLYREQDRQRREKRATTHVSLFVSRSRKADIKTKIVCSRDPLQRVQQENHKKNQTYDLVTTLSTCGPHNGISGAAIKYMWKHGYRDVDGRVAGGVWLGRMFHLDITDHVGSNYVRKIYEKSKVARQRKFEQLKPDDVQHQTTPFRKRKEVRVIPAFLK